MSIHIVNNINRRRKNIVTKFIEGILKNVVAIQDATLANHLISTKNQSFSYGMLALLFVICVYIMLIFLDLGKMSFNYMLPSFYL